MIKREIYFNFICNYLAGILSTYKILKIYINNQFQFSVRSKLCAEYYFDYGIIHLVYLVKLVEHYNIFIILYLLADNYLIIH